MSDLLVILGAGASYDALRQGAERPPLAADLFDPSYDEYQRNFPGVDGLRDTILGRMRQERGLEQILGDLAEISDENIIRQLFEVPVYLKVLLSNFGTDNRAGTYDALITLIQERELSVTFVTLNYDTILDSAIERKYRTPIESMAGYIASPDWNYIKMHGSVDWGYRLDIYGADGPMLHGNVSDYLDLLFAIYPVPRSSFETAWLLPDTISLSLDGALIYPALSIPTDRKGQPVCPAPHLDVLRATLESDPAILVVGNQGLDTDLMDLLRQSSRPLSRKPFHVVDPQNGAVVASRFSESLNRRGFSVPPDMGFREFVGSDAAERFFDEVRDASSSTDYLSPYRL
ncbi:MAG: hypothetical protein OXG95_08870 [Chloroflexi bacterium]|nr:hypothetical protein [Chloroflexota bacterium]